MRNEPLRPAPKPESHKQDKRLARRRGKNAETVVAKNLGGRKVLFSGAGTLEKGDVRVDNTKPPLFVETKYSGDILAKTGARSVSFQLDWVEKTLLDAQAAGCVPVIALRFANSPRTLYVMLDEHLEELVSQSQRLYALEKEMDTTPHRAESGE